MSLIWISILVSEPLFHLTPALNAHSLPGCSTEALENASASVLLHGAPEGMVILFSLQTQL